uniref:Uncharacterized protein n=1 Tax=Timema cristinae TaxID=61476 RepID=A0A7R9HA60_TIMCR|nr:unnamed protein product [Timema cristinae]
MDWMLADTITTPWLAFPAAPTLHSHNLRTHVVEKKDVLPQLNGPSKERHCPCGASLKLFLLFPPSPLALLSSCRLVILGGRSTGAKQKIEFVEKKSKSMMAVRKIRSFDEDFEPRDFVESAQEIYINAHNCLVRMMVTKKNHPLESVPPTKAPLLQSSKQAMYDLNGGKCLLMYPILPLGGDGSGKSQIFLSFQNTANTL